MSKCVLQKKKSECRTLPPIVTRILANRGITTDAEAESYFNGDLRQMHEPDSLKDIDRGAGLVRKAIHEQWSIRILGDYDVDGVCATAILYRGLEAVGAKVSVAIPHRVRDGYGLSERLRRALAWTC